MSGGTTNPFKMGKQILAKEGVKSLYRGLDSALMRQATYTTARLGIYRTLFNKRELHHGGAIPFYEKVLISMTAGFLGSLVGNPSDLALVRFQADQTLPKELQRNYKHVFDAFGRIVAEEGFLSLWKGAGPTIVRAMSLNAGQLATFEELKEFVTKIRGSSDIITRIIAVTGSGIVCSVVSLPFDNIKTKLQKQKADANGNLAYKGLIDCFSKTVAREGFFGLWVGLPTFIIRIAPHSIISLLIMDYLHTNFGAGKAKK